MAALVSVPAFVTFRRVVLGGYPMLVRAAGVLQLTNDTLQFEYEESFRNPTTLARQTSGIRSAETRVDAIASVHLRRRMLRGCVIRLEATSLAAFAELPARIGPVWPPEFTRSDAARAAELVSELDHLLASAKLEYLERGQS